MVKAFIEKKFPNESWLDYEVVQPLWSNYGEISRWFSASKSIITKYIHPPSKQNHPKGWDGNVGHARKIKSYKIEEHFYKEYSSLLIPGCIIPKYYGGAQYEGAKVYLLSDLLVDHFKPLNEVKDDLIFGCITWLAAFHASFFMEKPKGLWTNGAYWHLDTRREELEKMPNGDLKTNAVIIASKLEYARFKTIIHGDAKWANFLSNGKDIAGVDFQYVGGGVGIQDVVYFMTSCLDDSDLLKYEEKILNVYFQSLSEYLSVFSLDFDALETEWRSLYSFAWADFNRFLQGWSPGHWKCNSYMEKQTSLALSKI